jgi:uncharacterized delta-60 repeat protein
MTRLESDTPPFVCLFLIRMDAVLRIVLHRYPLGKLRLRDLRKWSEMPAGEIQPHPHSEHGSWDCWRILVRVVLASWLISPTLTAERPGAIYTNFNVQVFYPGVDNTVGHLIAAPDGSVITTGFWSTVNRIKSPSMARISPAGAYDAAFRPAFWGVLPYDALVEANGNVLVAGELYISGQPGLHGLVRLLPSGALDPEFPLFRLGTLVHRIVRLTSGRTLVGFTDGLERLLEDGTTDATFTNAIHVSVYDVLQQPDGKLFAAYFPAAQPFARFLPDGDIDPGFARQQITGSGVYRAGLQSNGGIVVAGDFYTIAGQRRTGLARLKPDGNLDESFTTTVATETYVNDLAIDAEDGVWIAGRFNSVNGIPRPGIARLHPDGSLDQSFAPPPVNPPVVWCLCLQGADRVVIGGAFRRVGPVAKSGFARLDRTGAIDPTFNTGSELGTEFSTVLIRTNGTMRCLWREPLPAKTFPRCHSSPAFGEVTCRP